MYCLKHLSNVFAGSYLFVSLFLWSWNRGFACDRNRRNAVDKQSD